MDILMTYWNHVWKQVVMDSEHSFRNHSKEEMRAFERSRGRRLAGRRRPAGKTANDREVAPNTAH